MFLFSILSLPFLSCFHIQISFFIQKSITITTLPYQTPLRVIIISSAITSKSLRTFNSSTIPIIALSNYKYIPSTSSYNLKFLSISHLSMITSHNIISISYRTVIFTPLSCNTYNLIIIFINTFPILKIIPIITHQTIKIIIAFFASYLTIQAKIISFILPIRTST